MKLSLPLAVVLALLANLVPSFGRTGAEAASSKSSGQLSPPQR
jgi:hypothetical protein